MFILNKIDKLCFRHDMVHGGFKDLLEEQYLIKYCMTKCIILLKIQSIMANQEVLLQWFINFLIETFLLRMPVNL